MTEPKTCRTCGPGGDYCEWMDDETYYCEVLQFDEDPEEPECDIHIRLREQRERAEKAEARISELEGALTSCVDWSTVCSTRESLAYRVEFIARKALEASDD